MSIVITPMPIPKITPPRLLIRYFGAYPEGVSFAILIMNSVVPLLNKWFHAKKYGSDVDQYDDGANGDSNVVLTSGLKIMDMNVELQLNNIKEGTFKGGNVLLGADTDSTGYVSEEGRCQLSADTITKIDEAFAKVKSGEIVPAANFNGLTPEAFTGL